MNSPKYFTEHENNPFSKPALSKCICECCHASAMLWQCFHAFKWIDHLWESMRWHPNSNSKI